LVNRQQWGLPVHLPVSELLSPSVSVLANRRILVAEDEALVAIGIEAMLQGFGCEVVGPVSGVREILQIIAAEPLDGALLDINLRGQQVFAILPEIIGRGIPIMLASGYDDSTLFPPAFRDLPRIAKPFDEATLRRMCTRLVESR
jgi:CheY-like chemotaxis protein